MIKLTLTFKGRLLSVFRVEAELSVIGRDPDCDVFIDSLAIAPRHAEIRQSKEGVVLTALDQGHPIYRNGQRVDIAPIVDGDVILIGKHTLGVASTNKDGLGRPLIAMPAPAVREGPTEDFDPVLAYLHIQSGPAIGQLIQLSRAVTRLHRIAGNEVIITRRGKGYFVSRIGEANRVEVGQKSLQGGEEIELANADRLEVEGTRCQFFCTIDTSDRVSGSPTMQEGGGRLRGDLALPPI